MSEAAAASDDNTPGGEVAGGKSNKLMTILILVLGPLLLTAGILAGLYFSGYGEKIFSRGEHATAPKAQEDGAGPPPAEVSYLEIKELLVNLTKSFKKSRNIPFLRLSLKLELPNEEASKKAEALRPRVIDSFQVYLRQLRTEDLEGGAGIQRLREELLKRANDVLRPIKVSNILFDQMLVQ